MKILNSLLVSVMSCQLLSNCSIFATEDNQKYRSFIPSNIYNENIHWDIEKFPILSRYPLKYSSTYCFNIKKLTNPKTPFTILNNIPLNCNLKTWIYRPEKSNQKNNRQFCFDKSFLEINCEPRIIFKSNNDDSYSHLFKKCRVIKISGNSILEFVSNLFGRDKNEFEYVNFYIQELPSKYWDDLPESDRPIINSKESELNYLFHIPLSSWNRSAQSYFRVQRIIYKIKNNNGIDSVSWEKCKGPIIKLSSPDIIEMPNSILKFDKRIDMNTAKKYVLPFED